MNPSTLRRTGELLFGPKWQTALARAIPVNPRTVRRWLAGTQNMRPAIEERIKSLKQNAKPVKQSTKGR